MCPTACLGYEAVLSSICREKCLTGRESKAKLQFTQFRVLLQTTGHARCSVEDTSVAHKLQQDQVHCNVTVLPFPSPAVCFSGINRNYGCSPAPKQILWTEPTVIGGACHRPSLSPCFPVTSSIPPGFYFH